MCCANVASCAGVLDEMMLIGSDVRLIKLLLQLLMIVAAADLSVYNVFWSAAVFIYVFVYWNRSWLSADAEMTCLMSDADKSNHGMVVKYHQLAFQGSYGHTRAPVGKITAQSEYEFNKTSTVVEFNNGPRVGWTFLQRRGKLHHWQYLIVNISTREKYCNTCQTWMCCFWPRTAYRLHRSLGVTWMIYVELLNVWWVTDSSADWHVDDKTC